MLARCAVGAASAGAAGAGVVDGRRRCGQHSDRRGGRGDAGDGAGLAEAVRRGRVWPSSDEVREGRGRKPSIPEETVDEIVQLTTLIPRRRATRIGRAGRWPSRSGSVRHTVQRIWSARGLKPHRVETFKVSNDPPFEEKLDRRGRAVSEPAGEGGGAVHGREVPGAGAGPHPAVAADGDGPGADDDP